MHKKKNRYDLSGKYGVGYDERGLSFYFDKKDYPKIKDYYWCVIKRSHEVICSTNNIPNRKLHRYLMGDPQGMEVDHINHNRADCRKENMRVCTHQQNEYNVPKQRNNSTGHKGVTYHKSYGKYMARISVDHKRITLGFFDTAVEAYNAYVNASQKYHGTYGCVA